jgi:hypothetical protein
VGVATKSYALKGLLKPNVSSKTTKRGVSGVRWQVSGDENDLTIAYVESQKSQV